MVSSDILVIDGLKTCFRSKVVHDGLCLSVRRGETLVLLGSSGAGKSTLLRSLIGLETPAGGSCLFEGRDLFAFSEREWTPVRRRIAYAFQGGALFDSLSVEENLLYPLEEHSDLEEEARRARVREVLAKIGLSGTEHLLPGSLSGGMQKRVGLARAIILDPDIILYDEPTAGLDPLNSRKISESIRMLQAAGKTSILVTHDTDCALRVADRLAFIQEGRIAALQTLDEWSTAPSPLIRAYFDGEDIT